MKVRVTVRTVKKYDRISFVFPSMEAASQFMGVTMQTAECEVEFDVEPIYRYPESSVSEETTEEGDEE